MDESEISPRLFAFGCMLYVVIMAIGIGTLASGYWTGLIVIFGSTFLGYYIFLQLYVILTKRRIVEKI